MSALADVLDAIARAAGVEDAVPVRLGDLTLTPAQAAAMVRVRRSLDEFGGALLADPPGTGKTFVALAAAAAYGNCLVAAPASLRGMWRAAAARTGVRAAFASLESLSRGRSVPPAPLVIVDEAHRVANPRARRYGRIALLAHGGHILLLTGTPVRNRGAERDALLALFLGHHAATADDATLARCIVRRGAEPGQAVPRVVRHVPVRWSADARIAGMLRALPPAAALADGDSATALVATGLARCLASSLAALDHALVRRLQRGAAIVATLDAGRLPSRDDLRAWVLGDDAMQLAMPFIAAEPVKADPATLRATLDAHIAAVTALRAATRDRTQADSVRRARRLWKICLAHPAATVIAFTCFERTARAVFSALRTRPGVVILTGQRVASGAGALARDDVLGVLGGRHARCAGDAPDERMRVRLVIATDLMSEGVNLQGASVIVHLDEPWTPTAVEQRTGRAARMGSPHDEVHEYRFAPPRSAAALLDMERRHRAKRTAAAVALRPGAVAGQLRSLLASISHDIAGTNRAATTADVRTPRATYADGATRAAIAAIGASQRGFVAVVGDDARTWIVAGTDRANGSWSVTERPAAVLRLLQAAHRDEREAPGQGELARIMRAIERWTAARLALGYAGVERTPSVAARRLLARLDAMVLTARDSARPAVAARVGRIRQLVAAARGAGAELRLGAVLAHPHLEPGWLDQVERALEASTPVRTVFGATGVEAVLVLRAVTPPAKRAPARYPSRQAASTGTAAPR